MSKIIRHSGFTTIEVMFALALLSLAIIALLGDTTRTVRALADSHRESIAADLARRQLDHIIATPCANTTGADSVNGVVVRWTTTSANHVATIDQYIRYPVTHGQHLDSLHAMVACR